VAQQLAAGTDWLGPNEVVRMLLHYGIPACPQRVVSDANAAAAAAAELGYPVAVKVARGTVHKTDIGGVRLAISDEAALREAVVDVQMASGTSDVLIQPMVGPGTELIAGALQDPQFGPVVMLGAGGVLADMIADRQLRLAPLTADDADDMIARLRTALLDGYRGRPMVDRRAVGRLLQRLATLADDLPEVAELDLNPVICRGRDDLIVVDAKVRIARAQPAPDPVLRQLRGQPD
jgi:succinyl-CoA synthetase beta subunit